jgi:hypothetical protein
LPSLKLQNILRVEPDQALFKTPEDYQVEERSFQSRPFSIFSDDNAQNIVRRTLETVFRF